ncbi:MAG: tyrosine--tRNA ligase, partial [Kofleriaceae bacterium]|nr:tyrosine--tRNA ligase [Kofleriaceae bacterium]
GTMPVIEIPRHELTVGIAIADLLARSLGKSKSAARTLLAQGGAYINNQRISDAELVVTISHLATASWMVVRGGKKDYRLIRAI